ncbi:MAG: hypothetical protein AAF391_14110 [Bacteroidota bacterium]
MIPFFFYEVLHDGTTKYKCKNKMCGSVQKDNPGHSNLKTHLQRCIGEGYEKLFEESKGDQQSCQPTLYDTGIASKQALSAYNWIRFIVKSNQPLSVVESSSLREFLKWVPPSFQSLRKYILRISNIVKEEVIRDLPSQFNIMFDGWSCNNIHYVGIFAVYINEKTTKNGMEVIDIDSSTKKLSFDIMNEGEHLQQPLLSMRPIGLDC